MTSPEGPTRVLAELIVNTRYNDLPVRAVDIAKTSIIDGIGACLAGAGSPAGRIIAGYIHEGERTPEATVIAGGFKTRATEAALANGTMMHALDYDDCAETFLGHPTTVILPAVLAPGEGRGISGKEALLAYILGYEVGSRVGRGLGPAHYDIGWHGTAIVGVMAAAAAASKILGLDTAQTRTALGIAASLAGGLRQNFGTMTKSLHAGNAARSGVFAALLAQRGFTADRRILESPLGYARVFGAPEDGPDLMSGGLGDPFAIVADPPIIKLYPSCRATAGCIDAMLHLVKTNGIIPGDVAEIECRTSSHTPHVLIHSRPATALEAKFSLEYCMAVALADREVGLAQFTDERVKDPRIRETMEKVRYVHPPEMGSGPADSMRGRVEVALKLRTGKELSRPVEVASGDPANPLSAEQLEAKFLDCARLALAPADARRCLDKLANLDSLDSIPDLMGMLIGPLANI
jgi:2-methylcitrate dehydratase PrpD